METNHTVGRLVELAIEGMAAVTIFHYKESTCEGWILSSLALSAASRAIFAEKVVDDVSARMARDVEVDDASHHHLTTNEAQAKLRGQLANAEKMRETWLNCFAAVYSKIPMDSGSFVSMDALKAAVPGIDFDDPRVAEILAPIWAEAKGMMAEDNSFDITPKGIVRMFTKDERGLDGEAQALVQAEALDAAAAELLEGLGRRERAEIEADMEATAQYAVDKKAQTKAWYEANSEKLVAMLTHAAVSGGDVYEAYSFLNSRDAAKVAAKIDEKVETWMKSAIAKALKRLDDNGKLIPPFIRSPRLASANILKGLHAEIKPMAAVLRQQAEVEYQESGQINQVERHLINRAVAALKAAKLI